MRRHAAFLLVPDFREVILEILAPVCLSPTADQGIAAGELQPKPRHMLVVGQGVEPQRHLGELHSDGIQVHAVDVAVREEHPHLLQLAAVLRLRQGLRARHLHRMLHVKLSDLVDAFIQERRRSHGRLADAPREDLFCLRLVVGQAFELLLYEHFKRLLHEALRQNFRRVVRGRVLTLAPCHAVNEASLLVLLRDLLTRHRILVPDLLVVGVARKFIGPHKVGGVKLVILHLGLLHLVKVGVREEPAVGKERFIDSAQLVQAQMRIADAPPAATALGAFLGKAHEADHLLQNGVREHHGLQELHALIVKERASQGFDAESRTVRVLLVREQVACEVLVRAVREEAEQAVDRLVQKAPLAILLRSQGDQLQIAQAFQGVPQTVGLVLRRNRHVVQVRTRLHEKEEQEPVHVAQTLVRELLRVKPLFP